ncbi:MAG: sensor histidine kinase [Silicimonas sp.]|nr:sensor histidine kinase [Silicimonas sp.]
MDGSKPAHRGDVVLGEDWLGADAAAESVARAKRDGRGVIAMNRSPLARKIITFNLLAILVFVVGVLFLNPVRDSLVFQREAAFTSEAELVAGFIGAEAGDPVAVLEGLSRPAGATVFLYDGQGRLITTVDVPQGAEGQQRPGGQSTMITDFLDTLWSGVARLVGQDVGRPAAETDNAVLVKALVSAALKNGTEVRSAPDLHGNTIFTVATPITTGGATTGALAMASAAGEIDALVRAELEQILQMFIIAILVSVGLSLVLASTIANPLSDLAAAAEIGREKNARKFSPNRVRIPDLTARPDEIGRLSGALRGMVTALYDRIDANEQFAADVSHEIKNPLASLRSAVSSLRMAKRDDQIQKLLDVIEHDTIRLDRLVSDISNASRLDSELVKEDEAPFDLLQMIGNLADYLGNEAREKGVEFITDMPSEPIVIEGLESRLAQVFVNLLTNAISFCDDGDAIRVWVRKRENRVLVVVEDTGPGIPEQALTKIFNRFYTERPVDHFGNNSGLGLAISKQIVEAHGGVIWAENIRPTDADVASEPLGARFVVGLPV